MCLNHNLFFFWVSSLVYPNLLGAKGYVVVDCQLLNSRLTLLAMIFFGAMSFAVKGLLLVHIDIGLSFAYLFHEFADTCH